RDRTNRGVLEGRTVLSDRPGVWQWRPPGATSRRPSLRRDRLDDRQRQNRRDEHPGGPGSTRPARSLGARKLKALLSRACDIRREPMKIKLTSVYVDDQDKALRFYTEALGFVKKADFSQGPFRWLTVASPEDPDGMELQLALSDKPAAKAYQQAMFQQSQPAAMFFTDDVQADYERMNA